ncbi:iron ABC transporter permease [Kamptonema cortianum]|nr:iron ABC transporter permease [Kamptonema cortianum]
MSQRSRWILLGLGFVALLAALIHIGVGGSFHANPLQVLQAILQGDTGGTDPLNAVVWKLRLPRVLAAITVGAILGLAGSAFQALFRNPLAEPYIIGVSSGAAAGGTIAFVSGLGSAFFGLGILASGFAGGLASLALVLMLANWKKGVDVVRLLISGVVIGAMLSSLTSLVLLSAGEDTNQVLRWLLGSLTPMSFTKVTVLAIALAAGFPLVYRSSRYLNALSYDHNLGTRLGINVHRLSLSILLVTTAMVACTVGSVGIIGFLGLIAPHVARLLVGVDLRVSAPAATLIGAIFLTLADLAAQRLLPGGELPVGAVTAILGAPILLILLSKQNHRLA